ncbi:protein DETOXIFICATION 46, chloroplastic [Typha angustifolia]|uniref:protein DETOXIFICATION 46, chloroplastic n=1 Tax=Typha angustifolia TaxID=59011 RepID=UPI003C2E8E84
MVSEAPRLGINYPPLCGQNWSLFPFLSSSTSSTATRVLDKAKQESEASKLHLPAMELRLLGSTSSLLLYPTPSRPSLAFSSSSLSRFLSPSPLPLSLSRARRRARSNGVSLRIRPVSWCRASAQGDEVSGVPLELEESSMDSPNIWKQMKEIALFAGPATGLWICGPLMSLIDTMVIGQGSSVELAALGPGTVFCDYLCYVFMFLSIATSNMVATSLAKKDKELAQHQISMLLFVAFSCGLGMFLFTRLLGPRILAGFAGPENFHIISAANTYAQIRGFAWPAVLVGMVAQSASLGMKDSWGPLKALTVASVINGIGDIFLCCVCGYGIAGAAWATMLSQIIAAFMMMQTLNKTGFQAFSVTIPSIRELLQIFEIAAPVFITMTSKVAFYSLLTYFATSMGTITVAAHQVMINVYCMCTVWGEPLSQTAQSFMPELIHGVKRSLEKARMLLKSLVIIGAMSGLTLGAVGTSVPWLFPKIFTADHMVIGEMHKVLLPYFIALMVTPSTHSLEGTLLAGRDLRFLSLSMSGCFCLGGLLVLLVCNRGFGLSGCWWALAGFQWARFSLALQRLISPSGMLYNKDFYQPEYVKVKAT